MLRYMAISMPLPLPNVGSWSKEVADFQKKKTYKYLSVGESSPNHFRLEMWNNDPKYIKSYTSYVD
jgi:hypothetical protein